MLKLHDLHETVGYYENIRYFFTREKNDINGNPRYRVYIMDPDTPTVYETLFKCYESQIPERVTAFVENVIGVTLPF